MAKRNAVGALDVGPVRLHGDVLCVEVAHHDLVWDVATGEGRLIVVQSDNATFGRSGGTEQQLAKRRLRAVGRGRTVPAAATRAIGAPDGEGACPGPVPSGGAFLDLRPGGRGRTA